LADAGICIPETETIEDTGRDLIQLVEQLPVDREVHPLGTFEDSLEGTK
jgi:hypothetical protein